MKRRKKGNTPTLRPLSSTSASPSGGGTGQDGSPFNPSPQRTWYDNLLHMYEGQGPWNSSLGELGMSVPGAGATGIGKLNALLADAREMAQDQERTRAQSQQQRSRKDLLGPLLAGAGEGCVGSRPSCASWSRTSTTQTHPTPPHCTPLHSTPPTQESKAHRDQQGAKAARPRAPAPVVASIECAVAGLRLVSPFDERGHRCDRPSPRCFGTRRGR